MREIDCRMKGTGIKAIQEQNRRLDSKRNIIGRQGKRARSKGFEENDGRSVQILDEAKEDCNTEWKDSLGVHQQNSYYWRPLSH